MKLFQKAFPENLLHAKHPKKEEQDATTGCLLAFVLMKRNDSFSLLEEVLSTFLNKLCLKLKSSYQNIKLTSLFMSK